MFACGQLGKAGKNRKRLIALAGNNVTSVLAVNSHILQCDELGFISFAVGR
ncbi:hypothetical protein D3C75_722610 [compost metagenome]